MNKVFEEKYDVVEKISQKKVKETYGEGFDYFLANLLYSRGIDGKKKSEEFLSPNWEDNFNPFLFNDMEKIVERIFKALEKKEKILIYSDYDTDGIPGGALLYKFFEKIKYKNFENFIPNRNKDGYGLTKDKAEKIVLGSIFDDSLFGSDDGEKTEQENLVKRTKKEFLPTLVITIDCGITDIEAGKILKKNKIDLIITDHHLPKETLPESFGILDHKVDGEKYPDKNLCGAGTVFKLVQALVLKNEEKKILDIEKGWEKWLLDLVAISTVCDMVPLLGENRIFVRYGKIVLQKTKNIGLAKIIEKSRIDKRNISAGDLGFMIGPRINAASRLEDPFFAFEALAKNSAEAVESAQYLETLNNRRKYLTAKIMKEVWGKLRERELGDVVVIGNTDWPLGVLGLIAGKISEKYKRPSFVWSQAQGEEGDVLKGSCRSGSEYSVFSLMEKTREEFLGFGGHSASGGFEIEKSKIHALEKKLSNNLKKTELMEKKKIILDGEISIDDVNIKNYREIERLEPYGMGNQKPHFLIKNIEIFLVKEFGKEKNHLELNFKNSRNFSIKAITFFHNDIFENRVFRAGEKIDLVASFEMNRWNGGESLRLKIEDIK